jgi:two-component system nitrogen regulation response regulator NtrX
MAEAFIARTAKAYGKPPKRLSEGAVQALLRHGWPGNVRELKNVMERAMILTRGGEIAARDLGPLAARGADGQDAAPLPEFGSLREAREWFEGAYIQRELKQQAGNVTRAAERLGLDRSSLHRRMRALGIEHGGA